MKAMYRRLLRALKCVCKWHDYGGEPAMPLVGFDLSHITIAMVESENGDAGDEAARRGGMRRRMGQHGGRGRSPATLRPWRVWIAVKLFDAHPRDRTGPHTPYGPPARDT